MENGGKRSKSDVEIGERNCVVRSDGVDIESEMVIIRVIRSILEGVKLDG